MAEIGPKWREQPSVHVRMMADAFTPLLARAPKQGVERQNDVPYGEHPRQVVDIFRPQKSRKAPVLLFIHGGAFTDGDKNRTPEFYSNICYYFARNGLLALNVEYRLAPEARYPAAANDIGRAVAWVHGEAERLGGDPARIFLMAHSAGACHAAQYAYDTRLHKPAGTLLAGLIVVSGRVRADNRPDNPNARKVEAYFGNSSEAMEDGSPVNHVTAASVPTMIAYAEFENPLLDVYCLELAWRYANAKGKAPTVLRLLGHNHTSIVAHINTAEDYLGKAIREFIADPAR